ncbi:hypothetical protein [uncultured Tateyamaria sp.]|uniref:hypothetical protein n=1 Tax=Tateyamaria sp. 1078 TaxID=3417464 RepID=UPI00260895DC|nr:hypothetical protein [uncultured Tateyamaria sp.]
MLKHFAILALAALPTVAHAERIIFRELIVIPVRQIDATRFEVIEADGAGGMQMWCAAGIFSRKVMGLRGGDLTIVQARGPSANYPGRKSVIFTTQPVANPKSSYSTGVRTEGLQFSMTHAYAQCRSMLPDRVVRVRVLRP